MNRLFFALPVLMLVLPALVSAQQREWTDASGEFRVLATIVSLDPDHITLRKENGAVIWVELSQLSREDLLYLREAHGLDVAIPAADEPDMNDAASARPQRELPLVSVQRVVVNNGNPSERHRYVVPGLVFRTEDGGTRVVVSINQSGEGPLYGEEQRNVFDRAGRSPTSEYSVRWYVQPDYGSSETGFEVESVVYAERFLILNPGPLDTPAIEGNDRLSVRKGEVVTVHAMTPRQGAEPRIEADSFASRVERVLVEGVDDLRIAALELADRSSSPTTSGLIETADGRIAGVFLPVSPPRRDREQPAGIRVTPTASFFDAAEVNSLGNFGFVRGQSAFAPDKEQTVVIYLAYDRELADGVEATVSKVFGYQEYSSRISDGVEAEVEGAFVLKSLEPEDRQVLDALGIKLDEHSAHLSKIEIRFTAPHFLDNIQVEGTLQRPDSEVVAEFKVGQCRLLNVNQQAIAMPAGFWDDTFSSFETDAEHQITGLLTRFPVPVNVNTDPMERTAGGMPDGQIDVEAVYSEDESTAWIISWDGVLRRHDLNSSTVTHELKVTDDQIRDVRRLTMTSAGLVVSGRNELKILAPEDLSERRTLKTPYLLDVCGHSESPVMYGNSLDFFWVINVETGELIHRLNSKISLEGATQQKRNALQRFSSHYNSIPISALEVTPDGKHLMVASTHLARYRIEGTELYFEERSPMYYKYSRPGSVWISADGRFAAIKAKGAESELELKNLFGEGQLDFVPGGSAYDIYRIDDLSRPLRSISVVSGDFAGNETPVFDCNTRTGEFIYRPQDFSGEPERLIYCRYLPGTDRLVQLDAGAGGLTVHELSSESALEQVPPAYPEPREIATSVAGRTWNEQGFEFTQLNVRTRAAANDGDRDSDYFGLTNGDDAIQFVWSNDGASIFVAEAHGVVSKIDVNSATATCRIDLGCGIHRSPDINPYEAPQSFTMTASGLAVVDRDNERLVLLDPENLAVKQSFDFPLIKGILGSPEHEFVICSLTNRTTVLFDISRLEQVQRLEVVNGISSSVDLEVHRRNRFAMDTGFVSPFSVDGRFIFGEKARYDLIDGRLMKNEQVEVNGRYPNNHEPGWRFDRPGFAVFGADYGDKSLYRIEDRENVFLNVTGQDLPQGVHAESGLAFVIRPFDGYTAVYERNGDLKCTLENAKGWFLFPPNSGSHFLMMGVTGHWHAQTAPDEMVIVKPPAGE